MYYLTLLKAQISTIEKKYVWGENGNMATLPFSFDETDLILEVNFKND